jgi:hypothetical protein
MYPVENYLIILLNKAEKLGFKSEYIVCTAKSKIFCEVIYVSDFLSSILSLAP